MKVEKAAVDGERSAIEADPVKYLAMVIGQTDQDVLRYLIPAVLLLFDPAAVSLLLVAVSARR